MLKRILFIIIVSILITSCRCKTDFEIISEISQSIDEEKIEVSARIWEGQYEFINFNVRIVRMDSLYVKSIVIQPTLEKGNFPELSDYRMFSNRIIENGKLEKKSYKEQYIDTKFENLPEDIRKTNHGNDIVDYSITYSDKKTLEITNFSADVQVILMNKSGREIIIERTFEFYGEKECYFSAHWAKITLPNTVYEKIA